MTSAGIGHIYNINVSLYGDCLTSQNWVQDFAAVAEQLQRQLSLRYTHFDCMYWEDENTDLVVKSLKYVKQNKRRIRNLLAKNNIYGLDYTAATDALDLTRDAVFTLGFSCPDPRPGVSKPYYQCSLQVTPEALTCAVQQEGTLTFFLTLIRKVEELMNVRYGLIQPMETAKRGGLYFANIFSEHLSQAERQNLHLWVRSQQQYRQKIRDVYWGNLLTDNHLGIHREVVLNEINNVVEPGTVIEVSKGKHFFTLPIDILALPLNSDLFEQSRLKIRQVLTRYDLLMI